MKAILIAAVMMFAISTANASMSTTIVNGDDITTCTTMGSVTICN